MQKSKPRNVVKNKSAFSGKQSERVIITAILVGEKNKMAHQTENLIERSGKVCSLTQTPTVDRHAPKSTPSFAWMCGRVSLRLPKLLAQFLPETLRIRVK